MCINGYYDKTTRGEVFRAVRAFGINGTRLTPAWGGHNRDIYTELPRSGWFGTRIGSPDGTHRGFHTGPALSFASFWNRAREAKCVPEVMFRDPPYRYSDVARWPMDVVGLVEVGGTVHHYRRNNRTYTPGGYLASRMRVLALCLRPSRGTPVWDNPFYTRRFMELAERYRVEVIGQQWRPPYRIITITPSDPLTTREARGRIL